MSNFRFIETNIDVQPFLKELEKNKKLWSMVSNMNSVGGNLNPYGFLPLTMGVQPAGVHIKNSELQQHTLAYKKFPVLRKWLKDHNTSNHSRAAFFKLQPGGSVGKHIDDGDYYLTRDRYHFSLQGRYEYCVDDEIHIIEPGTFFWFNNKKFHWAKNIADVDRITFVFDLKHSDNNP